MTYQLHSNFAIVRLLDNALIPQDPANRDYQDYLAWLDEGNEPLPAQEPPALSQLTPEQKLANAGLTVDELKSLLGIS